MERPRTPYLSGHSASSPSYFRIVKLGLIVLSNAINIETFVLFISAKCQPGFYELYVELSDRAHDSKYVITELNQHRVNCIGQRIRTALG